MSSKEHSDTVVRIEGLWKRYGLPLPPLLGKCQDWVNMFRNQRARQRNASPWALRDITLEIKTGETLGIIGRNGAGKSTFLKVLAVVTPPTRGRVEFRRSLFPMIELNAGLHKELTGRENVWLLGSIMGLRRRQIEAKMPEIEEFCELKEWFDRPVRKYSTGMVARLGFSVAMHVNADILLVDEILAVGDIVFQRKSLDRMEELQNSGATIIFVSHNIRQVERLCSRALLLDQGEVLSAGDTAEVTTEYYKEANERIARQRNIDLKKLPNAGRVMEDAVVDILGVRFLDETGKDCSEFVTGRPLTIEVEYNAHSRISDVFACFGIATADSLYVSGFTNELNPRLLTLEGNGRFRCMVKELPLLSGVYAVHLKLRNKWAAPLGGGFALNTFSVRVPESIRRSNDFGFVRLEVDWPEENGGV